MAATFAHDQNSDVCAASATLVKHGFEHAKKWHQLVSVFKHLAYDIQVFAPMPIKCSVVVRVVKEGGAVYHIYLATVQHVFCGALASTVELTPGTLRRIPSSWKKPVATSVKLDMQRWQRCGTNPRRNKCGVGWS